MMQITSPASAAAVTALLTMRQGGMKVPEPHECEEVPPLNLCIRRPDRTPPSSPDCSPFDQDHISTPKSAVRYRTKSPLQRPQSTSSVSTSSDHTNDSNASQLYHFSAQPRVKPTRPFKAYPKDPLVMALGIPTSDAILGNESALEAYPEFRNRMWSQVRASHGGTNKNMRRVSLPSNMPDDPAKNEAYWEKRRKNNEAAKRSRDARRAKEDEIAIRASYLERENLRLKYEVGSLRKETERLRSMIYKRN